MRRAPRRQRPLGTVWPKWAVWPKWDGRAGTLRRQERKKAKKKEAKKNHKNNGLGKAECVHPGRRS